MRQIAANLGWREWGRGGRGQGGKEESTGVRGREGEAVEKFEAMQQTMIKRERKGLRKMNVPHLSTCRSHTTTDCL